MLTSVGSANVSEITPMSAKGVGAEVKMMMMQQHLMILARFSLSAMKQDIRVNQTQYKTNSPFMSR